MSISTAITNLLDAKEELKKTVETTNLKEYVVMAEEKVEGYAKNLEDEIELLVTRQVGGLIELIREAIK